MWRICSVVELISGTSQKLFHFIYQMVIWSRSQSLETSHTTVTQWLSSSPLCAGWLDGCTAAWCDRHGCSVAFLFASQQLFGLRSVTVNFGDVKCIFPAEIAFLEWKGPDRHVNPGPSSDYWSPWSLHNSGLISWEDFWGGLRGDFLRRVRLSEWSEVHWNASRKTAMRCWSERLFLVEIQPAIHSFTYICLLCHL